MSQETPIVLVTPETRAALEAEVERGGIAGEMTGGLLFGHPLDERRRLVVGSVRLGDDVSFGDRSFSLSQSRTSRPLEQTRNLTAKADYCGVWYLHRTPDRDLADEEWVQAQTVLEDPDYRFDDLVCLVLCFYYAELNIYASSFNRYHSARGQAPDPTQLQLTTERSSAPATPAGPNASHADSDWYKSARVAGRLTQEHERLATKYHVEPAVAPDGQMFFRLSPRHKHEQLVFYLSCGPGFPDQPPEAFLLIGGQRNPLSSPGLSSWSSDRWLVEMADELVEWMAFSLDQYMSAGTEALEQGDYQQAVDWLTVVVAIDPRTPRAARLLAKAQAPLKA